MSAAKTVLAHQGYLSRIFSYLDVIELAKEAAPVGPAWKNGAIAALGARIVPSFALFGIADARARARVAAACVIKEMPTFGATKSPLKLPQSVGTLLFDDAAEKRVLVLDQEGSPLLDRVTKQPLKGMRKQIFGACGLDTGKTLACAKPIEPSSDAQQQLQDEYDLLKALEKRGLMGVARACFSQPGNASDFFSVQEYYGKGSLEDRLVEISTSLPRSVQKELMWKLAVTVRNLHELGYCHNDIFGPNVLFANDGVSPVLIDFGRTKKIEKANHIRGDILTLGVLFFRMFFPDCCLTDFTPLPLQFQECIKGMVTISEAQINPSSPSAWMTKIVKEIEEAMRGKPFLTGKAIERAMDAHPLSKGLFTPKQYELLSKWLDQFCDVEKGLRLSSVDGLPCKILHGTNSKGLDRGFLIFNKTLPQNPKTHLAICLRTCNFFTCQIIEWSEQTLDTIKHTLNTTRDFPFVLGDRDTVCWDTKSGTAFLIGNFFEVNFVVNGEKRTYYHPTLNSLKAVLSSTELATIKRFLEARRDKLLSAKIPLAAVTGDNVILYKATDGTVSPVFTEFVGEEGYKTDLAKICSQ